MPDTEVEKSPLSNQDLEDLSQKIPDLMEELNRIARTLMSSEHNAHSISASDLMQSAITRLLKEDVAEVHWDNRQHFFGYMYTVMTRLLIGRARKRSAIKRGGNLKRIDDLDFDKIRRDMDDQPDAVQALLCALAKLREHEPKMAKMIEHRFFAGCSQKETAKLMAVNERTIRRWTEFCRIYLKDRINEILEENQPK
ncbi:MAG: sigma-70 family RNA polymerase sigma factor [Planctomycetota bacterium]